MAGTIESSIVRNVIREIGQRCLLKGLTVTDSLAAFVVKAVILHPTNEFTVDQAVTKNDVDKLIQICAEKLSDETSPSLDTIKMQICFDENYVNRETFDEEYKRQTDCRVDHMMKCITETTVVSCRQQECLFHRVIAYIITRSGLGNSQDDGVIRETAAALKSIYSNVDLENFFRLSKPNKERQLLELSFITSGIRLYNKECGRGSKGIIDVPYVLNEMMSLIFSDINIKLSLTDSMLNISLNTLEYFRTTVRDLPPNLEEHLKQSVINCSQYLLFLKVTRNEVIKTAKTIKENVQCLSECIQCLHSTIANRSAIPNSQVFPQFASLAEIWMKLQCEKSYLDLMNTLLAEMEEFVQVSKKLLEGDEMKKYEELMKEDALVKTKDQPSSSMNHDKRIQPPDNPDIVVLYPESTSNYTGMALQFRGYCCWTLIMRDRLLVQGNLELGVVCFRNRCYCFTSTMAADDFMSDPERYVNAVGAIAKKNLELVQLLELYHQFSSLQPVLQRNLEDLEDMERPLLKSNSSSQTDTHFQESNIVRSYEWNEWQMRRMAIRLANLRHKKTTSSQTKMSSMRRDTSTQAYKTRTNETQTKIDARSNVARPQVFLAGLRGTDPTLYQKIDLTLGEDE